MVGGSEEKREDQQAVDEIYRSGAIGPCVHLWWFADRVILPPALRLGGHPRSHIGFLSKGVRRQMNRLMKQ